MTASWRRGRPIAHTWLVAMATLPEAARALAEIIPPSKLDDVEMKQLRCAAEVLADAEFRECMLVRNSGPSKGQVAVSGYIKGESNPAQADGRLRRPHAHSAATAPLDCLARADAPHPREASRG